MFHRKKCKYAAPLLLLLPYLLLPCSPSRAADFTHPVIANFLGLNGHTVAFRPDLYRPITHLVRDYHGLNWDLGDNTANKTTFPFAHNRVDWSKVYGSWRADHYTIDASLMFASFKPDHWHDRARDCFTYGRAFAAYFGPSHKNLVDSAEIGNEPGNYPDDAYRDVFKNMASGLRAGDPKLQIVTCAMADEPSGKYQKSLDCLRGFDDLYDVINVHAYPQLEPYPTWRRSFPEDPRLKFLPRIQHVIDWRDQHAPNKPVWLTEFGYDASTKKPPATGTFAKWVDVTDTQQAQWLTRAVLVLSAMHLDRAYIYFFNDDDTPQLHGSSGLTRHFKPKPAFYAIAHLQKTLGTFRFDAAVIQRPGDLYVYRFVDPATHRIALVAWSPTGSNRSVPVHLDLHDMHLIKAEKMPLKPGDAPQIDIHIDHHTATFTADESPTYLLLNP